MSLPPCGGRAHAPSGRDPRGSCGGGVAGRRPVGAPIEWLGGGFGLLLLKPLKDQPGAAQTRLARGERVLRIGRSGRHPREQRIALRPGLRNRADDGFVPRGRRRMRGRLDRANNGFARDIIDRRERRQRRLQFAARSRFGLLGQGLVSIAGLFATAAACTRNKPGAGPQQQKKRRDGGRDQPTIGGTGSGAGGTATAAGAATPLAATAARADRGVAAGRRCAGGSRSAIATGGGACWTTGCDVVTGDDTAGGVLAGALATGPPSCKSIVGAGA